jgi:DNA-directed RNA polymerase sigma subunit (sigma70/sigma32)
VLKPRANLTEQERDAAIVASRKADPGRTLHDLAAEYAVSPAKIRAILYDAWRREQNARISRRS